MEVLLITDPEYGCTGMSTDLVLMLSASTIFYLQTIAMGVGSGFIIGFLAKKIAFLLVFIIGMLLLFGQLAVINGFIHFDAISLQNVFEEATKGNPLETLGLKELAMANLPFLISALIGFYFGIRK